MPFVSQAQRRFMYSQHPDIAKRFQAETPAGADLPEHVKKFADGGQVMTSPMPQMPQQPPVQPLELPPVNYKPYKPNPRTTRSLARRSYAIAQPTALPNPALGTGFAPMAAAPASLPGFGAAPAPSQGLPGFARGGVVSFADGGDVE